MADDATCGYAEIGSHCVEEINRYRALEGLPPFERLADAEACASREARLALEAGSSHHNDGCGWRSQASSGGGRGGEGSTGTIEGSVRWLPKLISTEALWVDGAVRDARVQQVDNGLLPRRLWGRWRSSWGTGSWGSVHAERDLSASFLAPLVEVCVGSTGVLA